MAASTAFDFLEARKSFYRVIRNVADEKTLDPYKAFVQECPASDTEKKVAVDQAFRDVLRDLSSTNQGCDVYRHFVCSAIEAAQAELCATSVPFLLLTDIFDVITLDQCEELFNLVEDKVKVWKSETFYITGKNFLLRMCNDLLRRLSKSQNTVFCGRIQLFLSRLFPLAEKSALNLMSQFNVENVTLYSQRKEGAGVSGDNEDEEEKAEVPEVKMEVEDGEMNEKKTDFPIDYNLYRKFWSLQDFFRKPGQCYEKKSWATFTTNADAVLQAFTSSKLDDLKASKKNVAGEKKVLEADAFFAKYLTSEKLLDLQLNDSNFRRYVLLQFLIIFQYLNSTVKFKSATQTLSDDQNTWLKGSSEKIYQLIRETPPDGEKFAKTVEHMLEREEHWNKWKNESCPDFERKPPSEGDKKPRRPKRRRVGDDIQATGGKVIKMGNPELTKLWNLNPNNMEACKAEERMFLPTLEDFFQDAIEQNDPEAQVEEEYKLTNDQTYQWKALRLLARRSPLFFTNSATPALELKVYLNSMLSKLAKQMPGGEEMKTEVEDEEEIKESAQDEEDMKQDDNEDKDSEPKEVMLNKAMIQSVADRVGDNWKKLATELSFPDDEIEYFESENCSPADKANKILTIWMEDFPDKATAPALKLALTEIGQQEIADSLLGPS